MLSIDIASPPIGNALDLFTKQPLLVRQFAMRDGSREVRRAE
jgi:hypothetical protein